MMFVADISPCIGRLIKLSVRAVLVPAVDGVCMVIHKRLTLSDASSIAVCCVDVPALGVFSEQMSNLVSSVRHMRCVLDDLWTYRPCYPLLDGGSSQQRCLVLSFGSCCICVYVRCS